VQRHIEPRGGKVKKAAATNGLLSARDADYSGTVAMVEEWEVAQ
jgi:hypothetical protein